MLLIIIAIIAVVVIIAIWIVFLQRKLVELDENSSNAMSQIGVQLSNRFDALIALVELTSDFASQESEILIESLKTSRSLITAKSTPDDVFKQEKIISEALVKIAIILEQHPEVKANHTFIRTMDAIQTFDNMVRTFRLIYNHSVTKMNREVRVFPASMVAAMLGFRQRGYL